MILVTKPLEDRIEVNGPVHQLVRYCGAQQLHRGRHNDVAQSAQNERIQGIYKIQTEIWHMFSVELETLLKSRKSKKRRFSEKADFILEASKKFAATGQTNLRQYFNQTGNPGEESSTPTTDNTQV